MLHFFGGGGNQHTNLFIAVTAYYAGIESSLKWEKWHSSALKSSEVWNSSPYLCFTYNPHFFFRITVFPRAALLSSWIVLAKETLTICGLVKITGQMCPDFEIYPLTLHWRLAPSIWWLPKRIWRSFEISNEELEEAWPVILLSVMHRVLSPSALIAEWLHNSRCPLLLSVNICVWVQWAPVIAESV